MLRPDAKYNGKVAGGSSLASSQTGTMFFQVNIECDEGETLFQIWLTEKNRDRAIKYFEILGADISKLSNQTYLEYELPAAITGKEISFGTKEDEYNGIRKVKVSWIGKKSDPNLSRGAAQFFGGAALGDMAGSISDAPISDDDIPF